MNVVRPRSMKARRGRTRLEVQSLEARDVPATILDLGTLGASQTANGAIFQQTAATTDPAQFNTFLRIDASGTEKGYNTDARPFQYDQKGDLTVTRSLKLADVPVVNIDGTNYREFYLHVRETASAPRISLDDLRFYVAEVGNLQNYKQSNDTLGGQTAVFDMDGAGNVSVRLDDRLNGTTGKGDAFVYIPSSVFGNATYVYLYSKFGGPNNANGMPEEWGVRPVPPPPPPATGSISGTVFVDNVGGVGGDGIWQVGEEPVVPGGFSIRLEVEVGLNSNVWMQVGQDVVTDSNGFYSFTNLAAGTYRVTRLDNPVPDLVFNGKNQIGSLGGVDLGGFGDTTDPDITSGIILPAGGSGTDYNFGMQPLDNPT
jgi:hypothetical protein